MTGVQTCALPISYDLVEKVLYGRQWNQALEAQWRQLPDYVAQETNAIVIADVSGSMRGKPLATSIGLAIYFAERNRGAYHNLFMAFSEKSEFVSLKGETLEQKVHGLVTLLLHLVGGEEKPYHGSGVLADLLCPADKTLPVPLQVCLVIPTNLREG